MKKYILTLLMSLLAFLSFAQLPKTPTIKMVTYNVNTGSVSIFWDVEDRSTVGGFFIMRQIWDNDKVIPGTKHNIAELHGNTHSEYTDANSDTEKYYGLPNPNKRQETYYVKSYRTISGNQIISNFSEPHSLIYLHEATFEPCLKEVKLQWSKYQGWGTDLRAYIVSARTEDEKIPTQIGSLGSTDTTFIHDTNNPYKKLERNKKYLYYITAQHSSGTLNTKSNVQSVDASSPKPPSTFIAKHATVNDNNQIEVEFSIADASPDIQNYVIEWGLSTTPGTLSDMNQYSSDETSIIYTHPNADVNQINYYRLKATDQCDEVAGYSNWAQNITLNAAITDQVNVINTISWTPYQEGWSSVSSYLLHKIIDDAPADGPPAFEPPFKLEYIDNIDQKTSKSKTGKFCYYVVAKGKTAGPNSIPAESKSATSCVYYPKFIQIPNAINPFSTIDINQIFLPKALFVSQYSLTIFNRWGNQIFTTTDPEIGWRGVGRGDVVVPQGTYIYHIQCRDSNGKWFRYQGHINVVY